MRTNFQIFSPSLSSSLSQPICLLAYTDIPTRSLDEHVYTRCSNHENRPIVDWGIRFNLPFIVEKALKYGIDPDRQSVGMYDQFTMTEYALACESPDVLKTLLGHGATPSCIPWMLSVYWSNFYLEGYHNFLSSNRQPPPVTPGFEKLTACFDLLVKHGTSMNWDSSREWRNRYQATCVTDLVMLGSGGLGIIRSLVEAGMKFKSFGEGRNSPFLYAVSRYGRIFKENKFSTFDYSTINGKDLLRLMRMMLKQGADMNIQKSESSWGSPWMIAKRLAFKKKDKKLLKLLEKFRFYDADEFYRPKDKWPEDADFEFEFEEDEWWGDWWVSAEPFFE